MVPKDSQCEGEDAARLGAFARRLKPGASEEQGLLQRGQHLRRLSELSAHPLSIVGEEMCDIGK